MTSNENDDDSTKDSSSIISVAVSNRMCAHMNDDHAVSVFAMAKSRTASSCGSWTITRSQLTLVTEHGATLQATLCRNSLCKRETIVYPFHPPLTSAKEARQRLVAIHHSVTRPLTWYRTTPVPLLCALVVVTLAYGVLVVGSEGLMEVLEVRAPFVLEAVASDAVTVVKALRVWLAIAVVSHLALCTYVAYHCMKTLKLKPMGTILWYGSVALAGIFPFLEFQELLQIHTNSKTKKASKTS